MAATSADDDDDDDDDEDVVDDNDDHNDDEAVFRASSRIDLTCLELKDGKDGNRRACQFAFPLLVVAGTDLLGPSTLWPKIEVKVTDFKSTRMFPLVARKIDKEDGGFPTLAEWHKRLILRRRTKERIGRVDRTERCVFCR
ncbi:hypothetical protein KM043_017204 [Ampulex compressa]|nr:hypothetical protein KM043_017204 [Ampulex compressa]